MSPVQQSDHAAGEASDLGVSLTDRCNLRCTCCMPEESLQQLVKPDLLTDDEIVHLIDIAVPSPGIKEVHISGGEPDPRSKGQGHFLDKLDLKSVLSWRGCLVSRANCGGWWLCT